MFMIRICVLLMYCTERVVLSLAIIFLVSLQSCHTSASQRAINAPRFESLVSFDRTVQSTIDSTIVGREEFYVVKDAICNKKLIEMIDSFVCTMHWDVDSSLRNQHVYFLRESEITNSRHLKENPKDMDRYSLVNDVISLYIWSWGKFLYKSIDLCSVEEEPMIARLDPCSERR